MDGKQEWLGGCWDRQLPRQFEPLDDFFITNDSWRRGSRHLLQPNRGCNRNRTDCRSTNRISRSCPRLLDGKTTAMCYETSVCDHFTTTCRFCNGSTHPLFSGLFIGTTESLRYAKTATGKHYGSRSRPTDRP